MKTILHIQSKGGKAYAIIKQHHDPRKLYTVELYDMETDNGASVNCPSLEKLTNQLKQRIEWGWYGKKPIIKSNLIGFEV